MPDTACVIVSNPAPIIPSFTPDVTSGCFPVPVAFTNTSTGGNVASMFVDYGDGISEVLTGTAGSNHLYELPGVYTVSLIVTSDIGCIYNATFPNMISVFNKPNAYFDILPNPVSMFNPYVQLINNSSQDVVSYVWDIEEGTPATSTDESVYTSFPDGVAANYEVTLDVVNADGCTATVKRIVQVVSEVLIYAPNAFTPDGDEVNQTWFVYIDGIDVTGFDLRVYNRWGETVWESHDPNGQWDGTYKGQIIPAGIYNWTIQVKDATDDSSHVFEGSMTVLR
jgi:gliding motility-associated-like protein